MRIYKNEVIPISVFSFQSKVLGPVATLGTERGKLGSARWILGSKNSVLDWIEISYNEIWELL